MTEAERADYKEKARKIMVDHLTTLGYPDITDQQICDELKPMYIKLEEAGMVVGDLTFKSFIESANQALIMKQMREMFNF